MSAEQQKSKIKVKQSPNRCPYCHDHCEVEEAVVCRDCLARHHVGCWNEGVGCSACHCETRLESSARPKLTPKRVSEVLREHGYEQVEVREFLRESQLQSTDSSPKKVPYDFLFFTLALLFGVPAAAATIAGKIATSFGASIKDVLKASLAFGIVGTAAAVAMTVLIWFQYADRADS